MRNSTGWKTGGRKGAGTGGLRRHGISLLMLGAFALVAAGAAAEVGGEPSMDTLTVIGIVTCLAGWRIVVVARRREHLWGRRGSGS